MTRLLKMKRKNEKMSQANSVIYNAFLAWRNTVNASMPSLTDRKMLAQLASTIYRYGRSDDRYSCEWFFNAIVSSKNNHNDTISSDEADNFYCQLRDMILARAMPPYPNLNEKLYLV